jgi:hypothetical protein
MKTKRRHRHLARAVRLIPLAMVAVLLAGPVLAALPALLDCNGGCCCCSTPPQKAVSELRSAQAVNADCCRPAGATACRMSTGDRSPPPMAMTRPAAASTGQGMPPLVAGVLSTYPSSSATVARFRTDSDPPVGSAPIFLATCRLIC